MTISYTSMDAPIGRLWLATTKEGICRLGLPCESEEEFLGWLLKQVTPSPPRQDPARLDAIVIQLREYFSKQRNRFQVPLDLRGTAFQKAVWEQTAQIPYGNTVTYGEIAQRMGRGPGSARSVGAAMGANPVPIIIPCHRVLGAQGKLVGYGGGLEIKETLLRLEGCRF